MTIDFQQRRVEIDRYARSESRDLTRVHIPNLAAYAVTRDDKLLIVETVRNIRNRDWDLPQYNDKPWIVIGHPEVQADGSVLISEGVAITPKQMALMFLNTNYHPNYILIGFYLDIVALMPHELKRYLMKGNDIQEVFNLEGPLKTWHSIYIEHNGLDLFKKGLESKEMKGRLLSCSKETVDKAREAYFTVYRGPEYYYSKHELLYTVVFLGDKFSTDPVPNWKRIMEKSYLYTTQDLKKELGLEKVEEIVKLAKKDPEILRRYNQAIRNECELCASNIDLIAPGRFKGSVLETEMGAGPGFYTHTIVHSHPLVDPKGEIIPSLEDLKVLSSISYKHFIEGGEGFPNVHRIIHRPFSITVQPADESGESFWGLVYRERQMTKCREKLPIETNEELTDLFERKGQHDNSD